LNGVVQLTTFRRSAIRIYGWKESALNEAIRRAKQPPTVNCDCTPSAAVSFVPELRGAADIPAKEAWMAQMIGLYQAEVTIRRVEHTCMEMRLSMGALE
jgi:hypothetical protein